jgi:hypothetical protein
MPIISAFRTLRQEDQELQVSLGCTVRHCLKKKKKKSTLLSVLWVLPEKVLPLFLLMDHLWSPAFLPSLWNCFLPFLLSPVGMSDIAKFQAPVLSDMSMVLLSE